MKYLTPSQAQKQFGYHPKTLAAWADEGKVDVIRSPGGHRRYSLASLQRVMGTDTREVILYARVSTRGQKEDLTTQIDYLSRRYPKAKLLSDIGSGMNFKRKNFIKLIEMVMNGDVGKIVVAHKDRLTRFGFDFVEWLCAKFDCSIEVLNHTYKSPHAELIEDLLAIIHCFSSKLYFLRRYKNDIKKDFESTETE